MWAWGRAQRPTRRGRGSRARRGRELSTDLDGFVAARLGSCYTEVTRAGCAAVTGSSEWGRGGPNALTRLYRFVDAGSDLARTNHKGRLTRPVVIYNTPPEPYKAKSEALIDI